MKNNDGSMSQRQQALRKSLYRMASTKMTDREFLALTSNGCRRLGIGLRPVNLRGEVAQVLLDGDVVLERHKSIEEELPPPAGLDEQRPARKEQQFEPSRVSCALEVNQIAIAAMVG